LSSTDAIDDLRRRAEELADQWLDDYRHAIRSLSEGVRQVYFEIQGQTDEPRPYELDLPDVIEAREGPAAPARHVYADGEGSFPARLNPTLEAPVMDCLLSRPDVVGWLRNFDRKRWALRIPYRKADGSFAPLYPDFLVFRQHQGGIVVDLIDPHSTGFADAEYKAVGLAQYADRHMASYGRILMIDAVQGQLRALNLHDPRVRRDVRGTGSVDDLRRQYARAPQLDELLP
jgi:type III restriction enzyme